MHEERTQGIVLRSLDYKDNQRIVTGFTPIGLISLIVKGIAKKNSALTTPFCEAEFVLKKGRSDLWLFLDGTVLNSHLSLREKLPSLQAAGSMAQVILSSQLPGKSSYDLYSLFRAYLQQIPSFESPASLVASFQLKLLGYEGLLAPPLEEGFSFSQEEWPLLQQLYHAKQYSALRSLVLPAHMPQKIDIFFKYRIANQ